MELVLLPANDQVSLSQYERVKRICEGSLSLEQLVLQWLCHSARRGLVVSRHDDTPFPCVGMLFQSGNASLAVACWEIGQALAPYAGYQPLNETIFHFSDQEGCFPDSEWFHSRNERLGIDFDDLLNLPLVPAQALGEVVLSYALSSSGYARLVWRDRCEQGARKTAPFIKAELVFLGNAHEATPGFTETVAVYEQALSRLVANQNSPFDLAWRGHVFH